uniref:Uncharacterized protein n=1 Tax=Branchiostoma floridae TaxID=7739 RepID=C3YU59_BRAFL|eukprot:XP_002600324.1 hypothetical protein BRAFLDRAFT_66826 [Branchiostoma floridae]
MAEFPYGAARWLGRLQIFLGLAAMGLGIGDAVTFRSIGSSDFNLHYLGAGFWLGLIIGATQAMSLLNTVFFAPGLVFVAVVLSSQTYPFIWYLDPIMDRMFYMEIALVVVGGLEFMLSIATASVCCCSGRLYTHYQPAECCCTCCGSYDQLAVNQQIQSEMAAFPYRSVRGLGALQVFLSVVSICLGIGDFVAGLTFSRGVPSDSPSAYYGFYYLGGFRVFYIFAGVWTGLFIGAILTMSMLNIIVFAPGLIGFSVASFVESSKDLAWSGFGGFTALFAQEITLTIVGCLEWILSIVTVTVCFRSDAYDQRAVNQVGPMSTKTSDLFSQRPSRGYSERASLNTDGPSTSKQTGESNEVSERKVNNLAPEIGVRRTRKPSPISMDENDAP